MISATLGFNEIAERTVPMMPDYRLGELLTRREIITPDQLDEALIYQQQHQLSIGEALVTLGYTNKARVRRALIKQHWLRRYTAVVTLVMAPLSFCYGSNDELEQLPEYSYTQVAQPPCPHETSDMKYGFDNQDLDTIQATTAALWYVSQGGVDESGLNDIPFQLHLSSEGLNKGVSVNLSVRF